jgi:hypothetical protein
LKIFDKVTDAVFLELSTLTFVCFNKYLDDIIVVYILHESVFAQKLETVKNI